MFASTLSPTRAHPSLANAYARVEVETGTLDANPHKLIQMLFDGLQDAIARARGALASGQVEAKGRAIAHAARIVEEGLKSALDLQAGGKIAEDLNALYAYMTLRLTHANLHNDAAALDECAKLLDPVRSAWAEIGPRVTAAR
jgi:flagellar secretion chaperone FliS